MLYFGFQRYTARSYTHELFTIYYHKETQNHSHCHKRIMLWNKNLECWKSNGEKAAINGAHCSRCTAGTVKHAYRSKCWVHMKRLQQSSLRRYSSNSQHVHQWQTYSIRTPSRKRFLLNKITLTGRKKKVFVYSYFPSLRLLRARIESHRKTQSSRNSNDNIALDNVTKIIPQP